MPHRAKIEEPPEPVVLPKPDSLLTLGTAQSLFNAAWKLLPVLWFVFQFYANQSAIGERTDSNKKAIEKLQNDFRKMDREVTKAAADIESLQRVQNNDRQFFLETAPPGRRR